MKQSLYALRLNVQWINFINPILLLLIMTSLVACLGAGNGTWTHIMKLIDDEEWENVFLVTNIFGAQKFSCSKPVEFIIIDENRYTLELRDEIISKLKGKITDTEVALNLISGTGKEHMATIGAVLKLGFAVRLVAVTPNGVKEI